MTSTREQNPLSDALKNRFNISLFQSYYLDFKPDLKNDFSNKQPAVTEKQIEQQLKPYIENPTKEPPHHPVFDQWFERLISQGQHGNAVTLLKSLFEDSFLGENDRFIDTHQNLCKTYLYYRFINEYYEQKRARDKTPLSDLLKNRFNHSLFLSHYNYLSLKVTIEPAHARNEYPEAFTEREIEQQLKSYLEDPTKESPTHPIFNTWFQEFIENERQQSNTRRMQRGLFEGLFFERDQRFMDNHQNLCKAYVYYRFMNEFYEQKRLHADYSSRFRSDWPQSFTGRVASEPFLWRHQNPDDPSSTLIEANIIGNVAGYILGLFIAYFVQPIYPKRKPLDPFYRSCKSMACFGKLKGDIIALLIPAPFGIKAPRKIVAALFGFGLSIVFGLLPILWFYIQTPLNWGFKKCFNWEPFPLVTDESQTNWQIGKEGYSKYAKSGLVYGTALFSTLSALLFFTTSLFTSDSLLFVMSVGGSAGGLLLFAATIIGVPLFNYLKKKPVINTDDAIEEDNNSPSIPLNFSKNKHDFRNNYLRAGITLFSAIFSLIAAMLSVYVFPLFGILPGLTVLPAFTLGAAIGGTIGGPLFVYLGKDASQYFIDKWNTPYDTDNNWDYAMRTMCNFGLLVGTFVGFIPYLASVIKGATLIGAASAVPIGVAFIGPMIIGAIGSVIGGALGLAVVCIARTVQKEEKKSEELHWSQRLNDRANKGGTWFGAIGLIIGLVFFAQSGLIAAAIWASATAALGGSLGMIWGSFDDKTARETWWKLWDYLRGRNPAPVINQQPLPAIQPIAVSSPTEVSVSSSIPVSSRVSITRSASEPCLLSRNTTASELKIPSSPISPTRETISRETSGQAMGSSSPASSDGSPTLTARVFPILLPPKDPRTSSQTPPSAGKMDTQKSASPSPTEEKKERKCYRLSRSAPPSPLFLSRSRFQYASGYPSKAPVKIPERRLSLKTLS